MSFRPLSIPTLLAALFLAGCNPSPPTGLKFQPSEAVRKLPPAEQAKIEAALAKFFGSPQAPVAYEADGLDSGLDAAKLAKAPRHYRIHCQHCHGVTGDGNGPTARFLEPRPRDFRAGKFKFKSTEWAAKPTREDLKKTLHDGITYTAMPSFVVWDPEIVESAIEYAILLSMRGQVEGLLVADFDSEGEVNDGLVRANVERVFGEWAEAKDRVVVPEKPMPASTPESVARGKEYFLKGAAQCASCHGEDGTGKAGKDQKDDWGFATKPADLTRGIYRGGGRPIDLYRRIHQGVPGSPMPGFGRQLAPDQVWDLVHFVYGLKKAQV